METTTSSSIPILSSLEEFDSIRASPQSVNRVQNVDVVTTDSQQTLNFCHLAIIMPTTVFRPNRVPLQNGVAQGEAAVFLAAQHLNTGNGTIVQAVKGLHERCDIRFTAELFDTELSQSTAVDQVISLVEREPAVEQLPCAYIGAGRSAVSIPTSIITGLNNFVQLNLSSTSKQLDDTNQHPLFGRVIPSDDGTAVPAILYLRERLNVKHLVIVHINDAYGNAYALGLQLAAAEYAPDMKVVSIDMPFEATPEIIERTVRTLRETQYRYIFGIIFSTAHYEPFMLEAFRQKIAGQGEHAWFFSDGISPSAIISKTYQVNSPLHLATRGTFRIGAVAGVPGISTYDRFIQSFNDLNNPQDIEYLRKKQPQHPGESDFEPIEINDAWFNAIDEKAAFMYDSAIALGLAACNASDGESFFDGLSHFDAVLSTSFEGATGMVLLNNETGTRDATSARFTLLNFVEDIVDESSNTVSFKAVETDVFQDSKWKSLAPPIFNDGTSTAPLDLPEVTVDKNYIGTGWRAAGLSLMGVILLLSILFGLWTWRKRNTRVIKASQPFFLYIICIGCFLMGSSIIPLSIDDEIASTEGCDIACTAFPWIFSSGWVIAFSALFTKTRRINKIIESANSFRRVVVSPIDVMKPMVAFLAASSLVLSLWTALAPPEWARESVKFDVHGRAIESYGFCTYRDSWGYLVALGVIFIGTLAFTVWQAWKARKISTEFAESDYIARALSLILNTFFIGVPVLVIANDEPIAFFFVTTGIIFVVSGALLSLIFLPKIFITHDIRSFRRSNVRSRTGYTQSNHGRTSEYRSSEVSHSVFREDSDDDMPSDAAIGLKIVQAEYGVQNGATTAGKQVRISSKVETLEVNDEEEGNGGVNGDKSAREW